jgi:hypothetical protein
MGVTTSTSQLKKNTWFCRCQYESKPFVVSFPTAMEGGGDFEQLRSWTTDMDLPLSLQSQPTLDPEQNRGFFISLDSLPKGSPQSSEMLDAGFSILDAQFSMFAFIRDSHRFCVLSRAINRWLSLS